MNLFSRSQPRAEAPVRGSVLTLPLLKPAGDGAPAYIIPRVRHVGDGVVTHLDNALGRFQRIVLVAGPGMGKSAALAFAAARSAASLLYGLKPTDLLTYASAVTTLTCVTVAASMLPAQRAARLDPMVALRDE